MIFPMRNGILKIIPDEYIHRQFGHALDKSPHLYAFSWVLFFTTELLFWQTPLNNNLNKQICTWGYYTIRALPNVYGFAEHITHDCCWNCRRVINNTPSNRSHGTQCMALKQPMCRHSSKESLSVRLTLQTFVAIWNWLRDMCCPCPHCPLRMNPSAVNAYSTASPMTITNTSAKINKPFLDWFHLIDMKHIRLIIKPASNEMVLCCFSVKRFSNYLRTLKIDSDFSGSPNHFNLVCPYWCSCTQVASSLMMLKPKLSQQ